MWAEVRNAFWRLLEVRMIRAGTQLSTVFANVKRKTIWIIFEVNKNSSNMQKLVTHYKYGRDHFPKANRFFLHWCRSKTLQLKPLINNRSLISAKMCSWQLFLMYKNCFIPLWHIGIMWDVCQTQWNIHCCKKRACLAKEETL